MLTEIALVTLDSPVSGAFDLTRAAGQPRMPSHRPPQASAWRNGPDIAYRRSESICMDRARAHRGVGMLLVVSLVLLARMGLAQEAPAWPLPSVPLPLLSGAPDSPGVRRALSRDVARSFGARLAPALGADAFISRGLTLQPCLDLGDPGTTGPAQTRFPSASPTTAYLPITWRGRAKWMVSATVGPRALGAGVISSAWFTGWNSPPEWGGGVAGFGRRLLDRQIESGISNVIEAALGSVWGEDPRYLRSPERGPRRRLRHALANVFSTPRRSGRRQFGWARLVAQVGNNVIATSWLPESYRTWGATTRRVLVGYFGQLAGNLFDEFWPDIRRYVFERSRKPPDQAPRR